MEAHGGLEDDGERRERCCGGAFQCTGWVSELTELPGATNAADGTSTSSTFSRLLDKKRVAFI
jgi:hypothetical protein